MSQLPSAQPADGFDPIIALIQAARGRAYQAVNTALIDLYWQIGEHISRKIAAAEWGDGVVEQLAAYIARTQPGLRGFTRPNLFRMRQFFETYQGDAKVLPLVRLLPWTHNLIILSQSKSPEEREFYLRMGDVPGHCKVGKCGFYLSILSGFAFPSTGFSDDESDMRLLRGINVGVSRLKWNETVYWRRSPGDGLDVYEMREGDLVIGMDRPLISEGIRVAKVRETDLPCLLLQRVASLKTGGQLDPDYLLGLLSSEMFVAHFAPETTGVSVPHISPEQINNFVIPIPPVVEQEAIVAFVGRETAMFDTLTTEAQRAIDLLQERRTALISAAVTGQIDVRGVVAA